MTFKTGFVLTDQQAFVLSVSWIQDLENFYTGPTELLQSVHGHRVDAHFEWQFYWP